MTLITAMFVRNHKIYNIKAASTLNFTARHALELITSEIAVVAGIFLLLASPCLQDDHSYNKRAYRICHCGRMHACAVVHDVDELASALRRLCTYLRAMCALYSVNTCARCACALVSAMYTPT